LLQAREKKFIPANGCRAEQSAWFGEYGQKKIIYANYITGCAMERGVHGQEKSFVFF